MYTVKPHGISFAALRIALAGALISIVATSAAAQGNGNGRDRNFRAFMDGAQETPSISTDATGDFRATADAAGEQISYTLTYSGLEGGPTLFAHVHLGQRGVAGGVM